MDIFLKNLLLKDDFMKIDPQQYAAKLKNDFENDPKKWKEVITPAAKADELFFATQGDYAKIWEEHCACCFKTIDRNTTDDCYASKDRLTWLCAKCYDRLSNDSK